jgi:hypothetical protein
MTLRPAEASRLTDTPHERLVWNGLLVVTDAGSQAGDRGNKAQSVAEIEAERIEVTYKEAVFIPQTTCRSEPKN